MQYLCRQRSWKLCNSIPFRFFSYARKRTGGVSPPPPSRARVNHNTILFLYVRQRIYKRTFSQASRLASRLSCGEQYPTSALDRSVMQSVQSIGAVTEPLGTAEAHHQAVGQWPVERSQKAQWSDTGHRWDHVRVSDSRLVSEGFHGETWKAARLSFRQSGDQSVTPVTWAEKWKFGTDKFDTWNKRKFELV